ncbi:MAG TPA: hypothetical protein VFB58_04395 [Chloroflexota bacterium]|nr:hypothetical protein [Chloroflexota bacterium]
MADSSTTHQYNIGDAVLVHVSPGVVIPGVIQDEQNGQFTVRLAQPWADETGNKSDTTTVSPDKLDPSIEEETGGETALPG